jgi:hypothetical protein
MAKKKNTAKAVKRIYVKGVKKHQPQHRCEHCRGFMKLSGVIPAASKLPELRTYRCGRCGIFRTVEDERELSAVLSVTE